MNLMQLIEDYGLACRKVGACWAGEKTMDELAGACERQGEILRRIKELLGVPKEKKETDE